MKAILTMLIALLAALSWNLWMENKAIRNDEAQMMTAYEGFLAKKIKGKTLKEMIREDSIALFKTKSGAVACAVMK